MTEKYYALTDIVKLTDNLILAMPTTFTCGIMSVRNALPTIQEADVRPVVHGNLIYHDDEFGLTAECSVCHIEGMLSGNYCPNCGAKLDVRVETDK